MCFLSVLSPGDLYCSCQSNGESAKLRCEYFLFCMIVWYFQFPSLFLIRSFYSVVIAHHFLFAIRRYKAMSPARSAASPGYHASPGYNPNRYWLMHIVTHPIALHHCNALHHTTLHDNTAFHGTALHCTALSCIPPLHCIGHFQVNPNDRILHVRHYLK